MSLSESDCGRSTLPFTVDREFVGIDVERHAGKMIAHEERVVRRDRAVVEDRERRLQLGRAAGQPDHQALLRIFHQGPLAIVERQGHHIERECSAGSKARRDRGKAGALHQLSSIEHGFPQKVFRLAGRHRRRDV